ncbi:GntR family transcriptional regulator [Streptococcus halichoeri]|uniref:GntR family transcriptional regulator n=1 Tax=Streptococcus halichoeri TaxID=254785 RepID=UPI000DB2AD0B|nr:GntR family transcriptional regulator [Streptococcus halichoeri]PZO94702.1 MAG: GntR family transcriptional regulator [Streptococcus pyogenes]
MPNNALNHKLKKLKHVQVYNKIFKMIQDGTYSPGMQLPSEPELAEQLNVSRATLRKSLALLQEDHLVINKRGKGNFIREIPDNLSKIGYENRQHPIKACLTAEIKEVELEFRIEVPADAILASLKQETPVVVISDRWYHTEDGPRAYTLSFIPIEVISKYHISLNKPDQLLDFLEQQIYQREVADFSQSLFDYTRAGNFSATKYILSEDEQFILIQENIYQQEQLLVCNKHYLPLNQFELFIQSQSMP